MQNCKTTNIFITLLTQNTKFFIPALCAALVFLISGCAPLETKDAHDLSGQQPDKCLTQQQSNLLVLPPHNLLIQRAFPTIPTYSDRLIPADINNIYGLNGAALSREINQLANNPSPYARIKLALLLSRTHQLTDSQRALSILTGIIAQTQNSSNYWYQWAQLLYPILDNQHRLLLQISQQAHTLRENSRTIEELNQKIEALRAIESSIGTRSP